MTLIVLTLMLVVPVLAQETETYTGDGFSFEYPAAWVEVEPQQDEGTDEVIAFSTDPDVVVENGTTSALYVTLTSVGNLSEAMALEGENEDLSIEFSEDASPAAIAGFVGGVMYIADGFAAAFAQDESAGPGLAIYQQGESTIVAIDGTMSDYLVSMVGENENVLLVMAQAPAGTIEDWQADLEALVMSIQQD